MCAFLAAYHAGYQLFKDMRDLLAQLKVQQVLVPVNSMNMVIEDKGHSGTSGMHGELIKPTLRLAAVEGGARAEMGCGIPIMVGKGYVCDIAAGRCTTLGTLSASSSMC